MCRKRTAQLPIEKERAAFTGVALSSRSRLAESFCPEEILTRLARHVELEALERELLAILTEVLPQRVRAAVALDPGAVEPSFVSFRKKIRPWPSARRSPLTMVVSPITFEGEVQGWIGLVSSTLPAPGSRREELVLALCRLAGLAGLPARNARLFENLREQSMRDELTGLHNRRSFVETLAREVDLAQRHSHALSLVTFDIDGFKSVNDNLGHSAGDRVLRDFARALSASVRSTDLVARIGGDEFVILMPKASADQAQRLRSTLSDRMRATSSWLERAAGRRWTLTFSMGVADLGGSRGRGIDLMEQADRDLYSDKTARHHPAFERGDDDAFDGSRRANDGAKS